MAFCTKCGAQIPDGSKFCTSCGAPTEVAPVAEEPTGPQPGTCPEKSDLASTTMKTPETMDAPETPTESERAEAPMSPESSPAPEAPAAPPPPAYAPPAGAPTASQEQKPTKGGQYSVLGTGAYFGMILVFSLPLVGFIVSLILTFAAKNRNLRNFSRAVLIWYIIGIVLCVAAALIARFVLLPLVENLVESQTGETLEEFFENLFENGTGDYGYSVTFNHLID